MPAPAISLIILLPVISPMAGTGAAINLLADVMTLDAGTIQGGSGAVSIKANSAGQTISLGGAGGFDLDQAELNSVTTTGGLTVGGSSTHTALLTVGALASPTGLGATGGGFTITNGGDIALTGSVVYNATAGNSLNIAAGTSGTSGNITGNGSELLDTTTAGGGNIVLTAFNDIGSAANRIHIGSNLNSGVVGTNGLVLHSTDAANGGKEYINKAGALNLVSVTNISNDPANRSLTDILTTGTVSQTGAINLGRDGDLVVKTLNNPGADINLNNFANDVGAVNFLSRNAGDTANASGQLIFYDDANGFSVVQAAGGGITFKSTGPITLSTLTLGTPATLNIDAGNGDISLSTTGNITIEGPGQLLARNINLDLANTVTFSGGVSGSNYVATQNNDLTVKATGDITINADVFTVIGGKTQGTNSEPIGPGGKPLISSNAIIDAGGTLKITTAGDFNVIGGGSQVGSSAGGAHGVVGGGPGGVSFAGGYQ